MVSKNKHYAVYELLFKRGVLSPPLDVQLENIRKSYKKRFGIESAEYFVGPIVDPRNASQIVIKENEVWFELPERATDALTAYG